ncbi:fumarylacetoacetate hydrolase [Epidermidibacterium keratini]|uniref:Fumarylacetoacetate hydrolase n=1 Tax=Epidermidibacterium keratini TaxID=1891644 RepID=A0A7L4YSD3_9ACTN|nr:fumarylacetoacetate hydrolase family protein [Epidermidibacterium keratini]QHC01990.1 fumarylacetoacetate hydrolase [Epidermidibacterium keratini]
MQIANIDGRAVLLQDGRAIDIAEASAGRFGPSTRAVFEDWAAFSAWEGPAADAASTPYDPQQLEAPITDPRQIFAIGLNYRDHADEAKLAYPDDLVVFTKFASSLTGPNSEVALPSENVDWEVELVVVIGREAHRVSPEQAREAVAGYTIGQDLSERVVQTRGPAAQFSFGKSYPGFAPFGPAVVTADELANPDALAIKAVIEGPTAKAQGTDSWTVQDGTTADLIFPVDRIISDLSQVVTLYPGDIIFTGTPAGVGLGRGVYLQPGDTLISTIEGLGSMTNRLVGDTSS